MQEKAVWQKENTRAYQIRLTRSTGLIDAMERMAETSGIKPATYIRKALIEKLRRDGYIAEVPENTEDEDE